jgi:hypothetical protein
MRSRPFQVMCETVIMSRNVRRSRTSVLGVMSVLRSETKKPAWQFVMGILRSTERRKKRRILSTESRPLLMSSPKFLAIEPLRSSQCKVLIKWGACESGKFDSTFRMSPFISRSKCAMSSSFGITSIPRLSGMPAHAFIILGRIPLSPEKA